MEKVLLCNTGDEECVDNLRTILKEVLKKIKSLQLCAPNKIGQNTVDYIIDNLRSCKFGVYLVYKEPSASELNYLVSVIGLNEQWEKKHKVRKIIPVWKEKSMFNTIKGHREHLRNNPLFMDGDNFETDLKKALEEPLTVKDIYPVGNPSAGLALNYADLACHFFHEGLQEEFIKKCKELDSEAIPFQKTVIAIPKSCTLKRNFEEYGDEFKTKHTLKLEDNTIDGLGRPVWVSMYTLSDEGKKYHVRLDGANSITTLGKLSDKDLLRESLDPLTEEEMENQRHDFVLDMKRLLDRKFKGKYLVVQFNDKEKNLAAEVLKAIKESKEETMVEPLAVILPGSQEEFKTVEEWDEVQAKINDFTNEIKKGSRVSFCEVKPNESATSSNAMKQILKNQGTLFLWITPYTNREGKKVVELTGSQKQNLNELVGMIDRKQQVQVIPLYADCSEDDLDSHLQDYLKGVNYVSLKNPKGSDDYKKCVQDVTDICIGKISPALPIGPVYQGFACSTWFNYLVQLFPDKHGDMLKAFKKHSETSTIPFNKIILLSEESCRTTGGKEMKDFPEIDEIITDLGTEHVAGIEKPISTTIFKVTYNGKMYLTAFEYIRALAALGNTERNLQIRLSKNQRSEQVRLYRELLAELKKTDSKVGDTFIHLHYNEEDYRTGTDGELDLARLIGEFIESQMKV